MTPEPLTLSPEVSIYLGDCLAIMPGLGPVAHVLTDAPYEDRLHSAKAEGEETRKIRNDGNAELPRLDFAGVDTIRDQSARLMCALSQGWVAVFCTPEGVAAWRDAIEAAGARYKRACFWIKPDAAPQFNGQGPGFAVEPFVTAWAGEGFSRWNGGGRRNYFEFPTNTPERRARKDADKHPTEKPLALMRELVTLFTEPGDLVLDCFMGSGTTGVACIQTGRRFVGIEQSPEYFDLARRRLSDALSRPDLFVATAPKAKQVAFNLTGGARG